MFVSGILMASTNLLFSLLAWSGNARRSSRRYEVGRELGWCAGPALAGGHGRPGPLRTRARKRPLRVLGQPLGDGRERGLRGCWRPRIQCFKGSSRELAEPRSALRFWCAVVLFCAGVRGGVEGRESSVHRKELSFAPACVGQRGAVFRSRPRAIPAVTPQRRDDRGVAAERLAPRRRPVHDEVEAPAIPRIDARGGGVAQPLLRNYLASPAEAFPCDAHPCSLHRLGAALEVARLGAGRLVVAKA